MGEQTILVCDVCGKPATETVTMRIGNRNFVKDYCGTHLSELTSGARAPRRGRRKGSVSTTRARKAAPKRRGRPPKRAAAKKSTGKRRGRPPKSASAKKSTGKRRGRPPKSAQASS